MGALRQCSPVVSALLPVSRFLLILVNWFCSRLLCWRNLSPVRVPSGIFRVTYIYTTISSANKDTLTSYFLIHISLISFQLFYCCTVKGPSPFLGLKTHQSPPVPELENPTSVHPGNLYLENSAKKKPYIMPVSCSLPCCCLPEQKQLPSCLPSN